MTKEAAIELLKDRKVYVNGRSKEIQEKLFELGFEWPDGGKKILKQDYPFIYTSQKYIKGGDSMICFIDDNNTEISAEEILAIDVVDELKENDVIVSGWSSDKEGSAKWISIVKSGSSDKYDSKVVLVLESICGQKGALRFDEMCETQEWTRPATEDEKRRLIDRLKHKDCDDARKILKEVFGLDDCLFKPFDKVLVRIPEKHEGWVNLYKTKEKAIAAAKIYESKEDAERCCGTNIRYLGAIKVEWEE